MSASSESVGIIDLRLQITQIRKSLIPDESASLESGGINDPRLHSCLLLKKFKINQTRKSVIPDESASSESSGIFDL